MIFGVRNDSYNTDTWRCFSDPSPPKVDVLLQCGVLHTCIHIISCWKASLISYQAGEQIFNNTQILNNPALRFLFVYLFFNGAVYIPFCAHLLSQSQILFKLIFSEQICHFSCLQANLDFCHLFLWLFRDIWYQSPSILITYQAQFPECLSYYIFFIITTCDVTYHLLAFNQNKVVVVTGRIY